MGKKKDKESPLNVPHRDAYLRMNFLYQAATLITAMSAPGPTPTTDTTTTEDSEKKRKDEEKKTDSLQSLGAYYAKTMKTVGKKLVIRTDPSVKRTICKGCDSVLIPGVSANIVIKSKKKNKRTVVTCQRCGLKKNFPTGNPDYVPFSERAVMKLEQGKEKQGHGQGEQKKGGGESMEEDEEMES